MKTVNILVALSLSSLLAACGGSDDATTAPQMGVFSLGVSDNPSDAKDVTIAFKQVVLKHDAGSISFDVSDNGASKQVNLLEFQGTAVETLVSDQSIPVGEYQMCIYMQRSETPNADSSYVKTLDDNLHGLTTNSNGSCGGVGADDTDTGRLFFNKTFTIAAGINSFVAEFDLNSGLQDPHGNKEYWTLKPTSVQLYNNAEVGAIKGNIPADLTTQCQTAAGGSIFSQAVYLYSDATALDNMSDFRSEAVVAPITAPIAAARVNDIVDQNNQVIGQDYEFGFVVAGSYSVGYTCVAQHDDPDVNNTPDDINQPFFIYADKQAVIVTNGTVANGDFADILNP
jgi:major membrane immunogen (membrane-anchored lipoprotein)